MKLLIFTLADMANAEGLSGKLNIIGAFRTIYAKNFPAKHRAMTLVAKLGGQFGDAPNPHKMTIILANDDGKELFSRSISFNMPTTPPGIMPEFNAFFELRDMVFMKPGMYTFFIKVNDEVLGNTDIQLALLQNEQPG